MATTTGNIVVDVNAFGDDKPTTAADAVDAVARLQAAHAQTEARQELFSAACMQTAYNGTPLTVSPVVATVILEMLSAINYAERTFAPLVSPHHPNSANNTALAKLRSAREAFGKVVL